MASFSYDLYDGKTICEVVSHDTTTGHAKLPLAVSLRNLLIDMNGWIDNQSALTRLESRVV